MWERKDETRFVDVLGASDGRRLLGPSEDEKARKIVFVCFDALLQHLHSVDVGRVAMADSSVSVPALPADIGCSSCRIHRFDYLQAWSPREKLAALHERDGVGIYLLDVFPAFIGQTHNAVLDAKLVLADNRHTAFPQQLVVVEQAACNRVFYCHESQQVSLVFQSGEHLFKSVAAYEFHLLALEEAMSRYVVETALDALYCYPFHLLIKNPASLCERDLYVCCSVLYYTLFIYTRRPAPLHLLK